MTDATEKITRLFKEWQYWMLEATKASISNAQREAAARQRDQVYVAWKTVMRNVAASVLIGLALCVSCVRNRAEIRIAHGSTATSLVILVSQENDLTRPLRSLVTLKVDRTSCASENDVEQVVWSFLAADGRGPDPAPTRISYGQVPTGYLIVRPAHELSKGCYTVSVEGANVRGSRRFDVLTDGAVHEMP